MKPELPFTRLKERYWHLICHRSALAKPGDFVRMEWFDDEIVAFNDQGTIVVFDNVCPHRGARIITEFEGNQKLRCPYHGWTFHSGKFFAPFPQIIAPEELARARFNTFQQAWCGDFLFAAIDPVETLAVQLDGLWSMLLEIGNSIDAPFSSNIFDWESDWRVAIENAIEQYHTAVGLVHPDSFGKHAFTAGYDEFFGRNSVFKSEYSDPRTARQLRSLHRLFNISYQHEGYQSIYLFPFSMIGSTYGYSYALQNFFPSAREGLCKFTSRMLTSKLKAGAKPQVLASFFASSDEMNRKVFEEDHAICKRVVQKSLEPTFNAIFAESEVKIARFRKWIREAETPTP